MNRTLRIIACAVLASCIGIASSFAAKPPKPTPTPPPPPSLIVDLDVAPSQPDPACPVTDPPKVTGIYQDGLGIYLPNQGIGFNSGGDLNIRPLCPRQINARLPALALAQLTGPMGSCYEQGSVLLKIPDLLNAPTGLVGLPSPPSPVIDSVHYYFIVDTNGDGKFGSGPPPFDSSYNLVWQNGIWLTRSEYSSPDRTVYELTTEQTSHNADLYQGGAYLGTFCVPLRLTVTRMK